MPPSYISHQGREFYCIRKYRGVVSQDRKRDVKRRSEDRALARWHPPLDLMLEQRRHVRKGRWWMGGPFAHPAYRPRLAASRNGES